ncbi:MAG: hypothetical protein DI585_06400 [Pseudomonas fluorescens]|nr:MAG: hypothetical protein DI585_06400 [Pseudomonas fluorescens]
MYTPALIDVLIALVLLTSILAACHRGLGKEMLHTVLFTIVVVIGYVLFRNSMETDESDVNTTVFWLVNSTYYLITAYVLTWIGMKVLSPLILGQEQVGLRSRFWAGIISLTKLLAVIIGLNLWFAVHSPAPHPQRLTALPKVMQESTLVFISDKFTNDLYLWLASKDILTYHKITKSKPTEQELREKELQDQLNGTIPMSYQ